MNLNEKLKKIIAEVALKEVNESIINDDTVLTSDLGYDSVQIIQLIVELESQFQIEIEDDDLDIDKLTIYRNLRDMIAAKITN